MNYDINHINYKKIQVMIGKNRGFFQSFLKYHFMEEVSIEDLIILKNRLDLNKNLIHEDCTVKKYSELIIFLNRIEDEHKLRRIIKDFFTVKQRKFIDVKNYDLLFELRNYYDNLKYILKNIESSDELYDILINFKKNVIHKWNLKSIIFKIQEEKLNVNITYKTEECLIVELKDFKSSEVLGSDTSFCLSNDELHFGFYTSNLKLQYFIFDFTKNIDDESSLIGVTIDRFGNISHAHFRNNDRVIKNDISWNFLMFLLPYMPAIDREYIKNNLPDFYKDRWFLCAEFDILDEIKILIKDGIDINIKNNMKLSALMIASKSGFVDIIIELLKYNVDINNIDIYENTALHYAVENNYIYIVRILLKFNPNLKIINYFNQTPLLIAQIKGFKDIEKLLY